MDEIRKPGKWLDDKITEDERKELTELFSALIDLKEEKDPDVIIEKTSPYLNSFMHFLYLITKKDMDLEATDEGVRYKGTSVEFDIVGHTIDFMVDRFKMPSLIKEKDAFTESLLSRSYLPMLNGAPTNDIMRLATKGLKADGFTKNASVMTKDGHIITIERFDKLQGILSTPAKKILDTAILYLTDGNYFRSRRNRIFPTVEIPLVEYGEACGYNLTPAKMPTPEEQEKENRRVTERIKEFKKNIRRDLHDISSVVWSGEETKGRNKGDYKEMRIISSHSISKGLIRINFDIDAAAYFVNAYMMQFPTALLKHDNKKHNAYVIGRKLAYHNSNDQNRAAGTDSTLSVQSILESAPEIPTIEEITARGQRNWKDKIKKPLEKALDENIIIGLIKKWEYRDPKTGETFSPEKSNKLTWTQYSRLMVDFTMINAPEQAERRTAKAEAAEQAAVEQEMPKKKKGRPRKVENVP